jgi:hypothetical protein
MDQSIFAFIHNGLSVPYSAPTHSAFWLLQSDPRSPREKMKRMHTSRAQLDRILSAKANGPVSDTFHHKPFTITAAPPARYRCLVQRPDLQKRGYIVMLGS